MKEYSDTDEYYIELKDKLLWFRGAFNRNQYIAENVKNAFDTINMFIKSKPGVKKLMLSFSYDYEFYNQLIPNLLKDISIDTLIITKIYKEYYFEDYGYDNQKIPLTELQDILSRVNTLIFYDLSVVHLPNELNYEKLKNIKNLIIDADTIYNLSALNKFSNLETLEIWRLNHAEQIGNLTGLQNLKYLSVNQSTCCNRLTIGKDFKSLNRIKLYDNHNLGLLTDSFYCLPSLQKVEITTYNIHSERYEKIFNSEFNKVAKNKIECSSQWNLTNAFKHLPEEAELQYEYYWRSLIFEKK
jgi:hypothetical protein